MNNLLAKAKEAFVFFDSNNDGFLSRGEFVSVVELLVGDKGVGVSKEYFDSIDFNRDNKISFEEFKSLLENL